MPTIVNYAVYDNLATNRIFFDKLRDFAVTCGWTKSRENRSQQWASIGGGNYGFVAGAEEFMELKSTGWGSNNLIYRFRLQTGGTGDSEALQVGGHFVDTLNTTNSEHPVQRNGSTTRWNVTWAYWFPTKMVNIPAVWFFGNSKYIAWIMKFDATFTMMGHIGLPELFDTSETEFQCVSYYASSGPVAWTTKPAGAGRSLDAFVYSYFVNGAQLGNVTTLLRPNFTFDSGNNLGVEYWQNPYQICQAKNSYSEIRPAMQQIFFYYNGTYWLPVFKHWAVRLNTHGLEIGEKVKYGAEEYLVFPWSEKDVSYIGYGFRIA